MFILFFMSNSKQKSPRFISIQQNSWLLNCFVTVRSWVFCHKGRKTLILDRYLNIAYSLIAHKNQLKVQAQTLVHDMGKQTSHHD